MIRKTMLKSNLYVMFIVISSFLISLCCFANEIENFDEKDGLIYAKGEEKPYSGKIIIYYSDGKVKRELSVKDGKTYGPFKSYYENGQIKEEGFFINNKMNGISRKWNPKGVLLVECNFKDGVPNGDLKVYYDDGQLKEEMEYLNGMKNGKYIKYFDNGKKWIEAEFKADKKNGIYREWEIKDNLYKIKDEKEFNNGIEQRKNK